MRGRGQWAVLVLAVGGCGGPARAARPPQPTVLVPEARVLGPVVLVTIGLHVLPLGCWDPVHRTIASGDECLAHTAAGPSQVHTETGDVAVTGPTRLYLCPQDESDDATEAGVLGFTLEGHLPTDTLATWPASAPTLTITRTPALLPVSYDPPAALLEAARDTLALVTGERPAAVTLAALGRLDLDGDGKFDDLYGAHAHLQADPQRPELTAVLADFGDGVPYTLSVTAGTVHDAVDLLAVVDLGNDGAHELVLRGRLHGVAGATLISVDRERQPRAVTSHGCF
ncbi:MAG: hypothetical protein IT370_32665 [Deltaproteobacteria bacterium]|nr:hypothetical protein [Deltaproteobacteria bacterium]